MDENGFVLELYHFIMGAAVFIGTIGAAIWRLGQAKKAITEKAVDAALLEEKINTNDSRITSLEGKVSSNADNLMKKLEEFRQENSTQLLEFRKEVNDRMEKLDGKIDKVTDMIFKVVQGKN